MKHLLIPGLFIAACFTSCYQDVILEEKIEFPNAEWIYGDKRSLVIEAPDTSNIYQLDISVRHSAQYPYQNLYIRTVTMFPSGKEVTSVSSLELINPEGTWSGECNSRTCEISLPLQPHFKFPETGKYQWQIEPYMRVDTVKGIESITLTCRRTKD